MDLEPHQIELLGRLVAVERSTPPVERYPFLIRRLIDTPSLDVIHPATRDTLRTSHADLDTLADEGLVKYAQV